MDKSEAGRVLAAMRKKTAGVCAYCKEPFERLSRKDQRALYCRVNCKNMAYQQRRRAKRKQQQPARQLPASDTPAIMPPSEVVRWTR